MSSGWRCRYGTMVTLVLVLSTGMSWSDAEKDDGERLLGFRGFHYPALSPEGYRVAYFADMDGDYDGYPDWTPYGRILFASNRAGKDALAFDVYVWDPASDSVMRLARTADDEAFLRVTAPRATPDGEGVVGSRYQAVGNHVYRFPLPPAGSAAAAEHGMRFRPVLDRRLMQGGTSRGVAWGDYNGDGYPDLAVSNTDGERLFLYRNVAGERLEPVTDSDVTRIAGHAQGLNWIDFDNDGDLDLFVARERGTNLLFENDAGRLARVEAGALTEDELESVQGCWADYDGDGRLDVFVVHAAYQDDVLYRNAGDDGFERVPGPWEGLGNHGRSCAWEDVEGDGDPDLYVANAYREIGGAIRTDANHLFRNEGGDSFARVIEGEHVNFRTYSYGVSFADYDDDGDGDLLVTSIGRFDPNTLFENVDGRLFQPDRGSMVMRDHPGPGKGHGWGDFDNDGDLDLFLAEGHGGARPEHAPFDNRDRLYENRGGGELKVAGLPTLTDHDLVSAGSAVADFDRDGDLDLFIANWGDSGDEEGGKQDNQLFRNVSPQRGWIQVRFRGRRSNRMGIGARVGATTGEDGTASTQYRSLSSTSGFGSMAEPVLHFGLGDARKVGRLEIRWPSGQVDVHHAISTGQRYLAVEGGRLVPDTPPGSE